MSFITPGQWSSLLEPTKNLAAVFTRPVKGEPPKHWQGPSSQAIIAKLHEAASNEMEVLATDRLFELLLGLKHLLVAARVTALRRLEPIVSAQLSTELTKLINDGAVSRETGNDNGQSFRIDIPGINTGSVLIQVSNPSKIQSITWQDSYAVGEPMLLESEAVLAATKKALPRLLEL